MPELDDQQAIAVVLAKKGLRHWYVSPGGERVCMLLDHMRHLADGYGIAWDAELMDDLLDCEDAISEIDRKRQKRAEAERKATKRR